MIIYFPIIKVDLSGNINTDDDFQNFTSQWLDLYKYKQNFEFEFDKINIVDILILYIVYILQFL